MSLWLDWRISNNRGVYGDGGEREGAVFPSLL